ncbi:MAG: 50S ribosomal protein L22 [Deltaproteobacteria bacterium]|nr:50S ribosomal protein L22 [Deltaproteobacteria bacterium]
MEAKAVAKYIRVSPRKVRIVAKNIKGLTVEKALSQLTYTPKKAATILQKVLNSALANAEQNSEIDVDTLYVKNVYVDEGPTAKRWRPRAMGRATRIRKRTSHVTVILDEI